jgi:hypothetical protein
LIGALKPIILRGIDLMKDMPNRSGEDDRRYPIKSESHGIFFELQQPVSLLAVRQN